MPGTVPPRTRPHYGLDAPGVLRTFLIGGILAGIAGWLIWRWGASYGWVSQAIAVLFFWFAFWMLLTVVLMIVGSLRGKRRLTEQVLDSLGLRGDETVLDVGCGRGVFLIGAAKRLTPGKGRAIGVDIWSQRDQWRNSREETLANAAAEGVSDRIELHDADMRVLPFADASMDAVVSNLAIHNLPRRRDRQRALEEILRVVKPGGQVVIVDLARTREYARFLRRHGLRAVHRSGRRYWVYPPVRVVVGTR